MAVNINKATEWQMMEMLPGIGEKRAAQLVRLRESEGRITLAALATVLRSQPSDRLLSLIDFGVSPERDFEANVTDAEATVPDSKDKLIDYLADPHHFPLLTIAKHEQDTTSEVSFNLRELPQELAQGPIFSGLLDVENPSTGHRNLRPQTNLPLTPRRDIQTKARRYHPRESSASSSRSPTGRSGQIPSSRPATGRFLRTSHTRSWHGAERARVTEGRNEGASAGESRSASTDRYGEHWE
ncbi:hypothetical protein ACOMHN_008755 [Nucella lapillus]